MIRKGLLGIAVALVSLSLWAIGALAQGDDDTTVAEEKPVVTVQPNLAAASVVQTVPVTLTLTIPGPTGPVTVEVPIYLALDIRIGISPDLTTTLAVTPSVATVVDGTGDDAADDGAGTGTVPAVVTPRSTVAAPTAVPTVAPTAIPTVADDEDEAATDEAATDEAATDEAATDDAATDDATGGGAETTPTAPPPTPAPVEPEPTEPPAPTEAPTTEPVVVAPLCPDPRAVITSPGVGQTVTGTVELIGTATHENFQYYKVEYAQGENIDPNATFSYLADARVQVTGGLLAAFDSANFANNVYTLKLTVVDNSGNFPPPCTVSIVIAN